MINKRLITRDTLNKKDSSKKLRKKFIMSIKDIIKVTIL